jgi:hydroxymethylglutaryl-CoA lyase
MTPSPSVRDVTLRDGLQLTGKLLNTADKVELARLLMNSGFEAIEIGAMARPDLMPPMANTLDVVAALTSQELRRCWLWAATPRGRGGAEEGGARK